MAKGKKKRIMRRFRIDEISGVDNPAQTPAVVALFKRADGAAGLGKQSGLETSQAAGHRHAILLSGTGEGGLMVGLEDATAEGADEPHTHAVVRGAGDSFIVGYVDGHTHTIDGARVARALVAASMGKGPALAALLVRIMPDDEAERAQTVTRMASAAGISESTVGQIFRGAIMAPPYRRLVGFSRVLDVSLDRLVAAATEDGGDYGDAEAEAVAAKLADMTPEQRARYEQLLEAAAKATRETNALLAKNKTDGGSGMADKTPLQKREDAEAEIDGLAKRCATDLNLTFEQGYRKVLDTPRGLELYGIMRAPIAKVSGFDAACDAAIEELTEFSEWDSADTVEAKRTVAAGRFYASAEYEALYTKHYAPEPVEKAEPVPLPVTLGLLSQAEYDGDPMAAVEKLATIEAYRQGITKEHAMAGFTKADSMGFDLMQKARVTEAQRIYTAQSSRRASY